jgi:hypothetical protein
MLDERQDEIRVIEAALTTRPMPLTAVRSRSAGAYLHLFSGSIDCFDRARRPGGRASTGSLTEDGGYFLYAGSAKSLAERTRRHVKNMVPVVDFDVRDFSTVILPTLTYAGARYVEEILLQAFLPVLNVTLRGYGSKAQGSNRTTQRRSEFSVLFPGRKGCTGPAKVTAEELRRRVIAHLEGTVPAMCSVACRPPASTNWLRNPTPTVLRFPSIGPTI